MAGNPAAARSLLGPLQGVTSLLEEKVSAAEEYLDGLLAPFGEQLSRYTTQLDQIDYLLTQLAEASFQLLPTEAGVAATRAVMCMAGKEQKGDPEGVLYLTDQRLLFEQKEEIVTKKVLFVATEKTKVQQTKLECPVSLVEVVDAEKQGLLKNENHLGISLRSDASLPTAHFHIWQDASSWQGLINRSRSKSFDEERAVALDQSAVDKVRAAPAQCPSCGGNLTRPVLREQDIFTCEYCGFVIRL